MKKKEIKKRLVKDIEILKNAKYGYIEAGLPRFGWLFGRDSIITAWQLLHIDPNIARDTLKVLMKYQGTKIDAHKDEEPGKIIHEHQIGKRKHPMGYFPFPYYGSVDSTPLFLILFSWYYSRKGDDEFLQKHWTNILAGIKWMTHYGDRDKDLLLEYKRRAKTGNFHQAWKDSYANHLKITPPVSMVEVQGYQYLALMETAGLALIVGDKKLETTLLKRAKDLKKHFNRRFWMKNEKYYAFALNNRKQQVKKITSNPGLLLFTGIANNEQAIVKKLFSPELWTDFGIRTHSTKEADYNTLSYHMGSVWPHDNWIIAQGLKKLGYKKEYKQVKKALLRAFNEMGFIPEFYGVVDHSITLRTEQSSCHPQAWSSAALLNMVIQD